MTLVVLDLGVYWICVNCVQLWIVSLWACTARRRQEGRRLCAASWRWSGRRGWQRRTFAPYVGFHFQNRTLDSSFHSIITIIAIRILFHHYDLCHQCLILWRPFATSDEGSFHTEGASKGGCAWTKQIFSSTTCLTRWEWITSCQIKQNIWLFKGLKWGKWLKLSLWMKTWNTQFLWMPWT